MDAGSLKNSSLCFSILVSSMPDFDFSMSWDLLFSMLFKSENVKTRCGPVVFSLKNSAYKASLFQISDFLL